MDVYMMFFSFRPQLSPTSTSRTRTILQTQMNPTPPFQCRFRANQMPGIASATSHMQFFHVIHEILATETPPVTRIHVSCPVYRVHHKMCLLGYIEQPESIIVLQLRNQHRIIRRLCEKLTSKRQTWFQMVFEDLVEPHTRRQRQLDQTHHARIVGTSSRFPS